MSELALPTGGHCEAAIIVKDPCRIRQRVESGAKHEDTVIVPDDGAVRTTRQLLIPQRHSLGIIGDKDSTDFPNLRYWAVVVKRLSEAIYIFLAVVRRVEMPGREIRGHSGTAHRSESRLEASEFEMPGCHDLHFKYMPMPLPKKTSKIVVYSTVLHVLKVRIISE